MSSPPELSSLPPFYAAELQNALSEQLFGIRAYSVVESGPHSALASVSLLEGQEIFVLLTESGYSTKYNGTTQVFEAIENLLLSISPAYEKMRQLQLTKKLEGLS